MCYCCGCFCCIIVPLDLIFNTMMNNNKYSHHQARRQQLSKCIRATGLIIFGMLVLSVQESWYYSSSSSSSSSSSNYTPSNEVRKRANEEWANAKAYGAGGGEESGEHHSSFRYQFMHNHHQNSNHHSHSSDSEDPLDLRKRLKRALTALRNTRARRRYRRKTVRITSTLYTYLEGTTGTVIGYQAWRWRFCGRC